MSRPVFSLARRALLFGFAPWIASCAANRRVGSPAESFDLVVAATTDVHGRLTGWDYYAGSADSLRGSLEPRPSSIPFGRRTLTASSSSMRATCYRGIRWRSLVRVSIRPVLTPSSPP